MPIQNLRDSGRDKPPELDLQPISFFVSTKSFDQYPSPFLLL